MVRKKSGTNGSAADGAAPRPISLREFGHRLDQAILRRGWTQADLHRHSGLSKDTISKWVRGQVKPTLYNLGKVANALRVSIDEIYPGFENEDVRGYSSDMPNGITFEEDMSTAILNFSNKRISFETGQKIAELIKNDAVNGE